MAVARRRGREQQGAEGPGDELVREREPEHVDHPEDQGQRRPAQQSDEEQPPRAEAIGQIARRNLRERVAQHARGRKRAALREVDLQVLADQRQQQRNRGQGEKVRDLAEHHQPGGDDPVAAHGFGVGHASTRCGGKHDSILALSATREVALRQSAEEAGAGSSAHQSGGNEPCGKAINAPAWRR
jgi:hypothetical protein